MKVMEPKIQKYRLINHLFSWHLYSAIYLFFVRLLSVNLSSILTNLLNEGMLPYSTVHILQHLLTLTTYSEYSIDVQQIFDLASGKERREPQR